MDDIIIRHCAPALAGLKTANLVSCKIQDACECIMKNGKALAKKGIYMTILCEKNENALLYVYRNQRLYEDLNCREARDILIDFGYTSSDTDECIERLKARIQSNPCFPHEIGLFLGYPAPDVKGFIEHKGKDFKCMGYWKVYCNECEARKTFEKYKKCIDVYTRVYLEGASIEKLTVAV